MGVSNCFIIEPEMSTDLLCRITKLMGESFKLHAQALVGYEEAVASGTSISTPTMSSQGIEPLEMEAAY